MLGVALIHALILLAVLNSGGPGQDVDELGAPPIEIFDVTEPPPSAPVPRLQENMALEEEGAASPPNLRSKATPVVVPEPAVQVPRNTPVIASPTPADGSEATQGAAPVSGPGTGAGGSGTGTGSGGSGAGPGGGGSGEGRRPTVVQRTTLRGRDYPRGVIRNWPSGSPVFVRVRVQLDGRATNCTVDRSSGDPIVDQWTCRLVEQKVRFRPARDDQGQPYVDWYGYVQSPVNF